MNNWKPVSALEYRADHRSNSIDKPFNEMRMKLGEPFIASECDDYPDDTDRTDVCWGFRNTATGAQVGIWNYKNGPNYCGPTVTLEDIDGFSVWASNREAFIDFCNAFNL